MTLILAEQHTLSLSLANSIKPTPPTVNYITAIKSPANGVIHATILPPPDSLYANMIAWEVVIGGPGPGNDLDVLSFNGEKQRPIAVRFVNLEILVINGVDDMGCLIDKPFWDSLCANSNLPPTLKELLLALVKFMTVETSNKQTELTRTKFQTIESFRGLNSSVILKPGALLLDEYLAPAVVAFLSSDMNTTRELPDFIIEPSPGVFQFELFQPTFCKTLISIIDDFEATDLPRRRPNTMNNFGMVLTEIGLADFATNLNKRVISQLSKILFKEEIFASSLDSHHTFCVEYRAKELGKGDRNLDMHHDASEITLNVCLGRDSFKASGLRFCGEFGKKDHRVGRLELQHKVGTAVLHLGRQRHGADNIEEGERINLIVWSRSSTFRTAAGYGHCDPDGYPREAEEGGKVDQVCLRRSNDRDYNTMKLGGGGETEREKKKSRRYVAF